MDKIEFAFLCNDQANMKVSEKPTGMNHAGAVGMQTYPRSTPACPILSFFNVDLVMEIYL